VRVVFVVFFFGLFSLGVICLFFPRTVQSVAVKAVGLGVTSRSRLLTAFIGSHQYLISVRIVGLIALLAAGSLAFASLRSG
jgi:hypothetical protein